MEQLPYKTLPELEAGLEFVLASPREQGTLELIARRPRSEGREVLAEAELSPLEGVVGDDWKNRSTHSMPGGVPNPAKQITIMNSRLIGLLTGEREFWSLAGDQLYVDLDLSVDNLPPGTRLSIGTVILEITAPPHTGCKKFSGRFGLQALEFISAPARKGLRLRGLHASVVQPGVIRVGDRVQKIR